MVFLKKMKKVQRRIDKFDESLAGTDFYESRCLDLYDFNVPVQSLDFRNARKLVLDRKFNFSLNGVDLRPRNLRFRSEGTSGLKKY